MTTKPLMIVATLGAGLSLSGCAYEAGSQITGGSYGHAVTNNAQYMTGEKVFVVDLANKFAAKVPTTVNFAFNSAKLDGAAIAALQRQAHFIKQYPEVRFRVYGHTDAVGSNAYNKRLGLQRAHSVVNYLVSHGISRHRLEAVVSFGETQPLIVSQGQERRNRRTVTEVSGFLQDHPIIVDGKYAEVLQREYLEAGAPASTLPLAVNSGSTAQE
jgi:peptidoglycan-associated lipoprotein